jgi:hypothetical protein
MIRTYHKKEKKYKIKEKAQKSLKRFENFTMSR